MSNSSMNNPIGYYIHHEGSGHIERAKHLGPFLKCNEVTFFSSHPRLGELAEFGEISELPLDTGDPYRVRAELRDITKHLYAPFYIPGLAERFRKISSWVAEKRPRSFHVDVSTEIAEFVTLLGVPFTYVRQTGNRTDEAHQRVYRMAQRILAPFPENFDDGKHRRQFPMTEYYPICQDLKPLESKEGDEIVYVRSSTESDPDILEGLRRGLQKIARLRPIRIIGTPVPDLPGIKQMGWVKNVEDEIEGASLALASAGDNSVNRLLTLQIPFLLIPERKDFQEQVTKARALEQNLGVPYVPVEDFGAIDAAEFFRQVGRLKPVSFKLRNEAETFAKRLSSI